MAKAKGGGKLHPLLLETFAECPWPQGDGLLLRCCAHRTIDPTASIFATALSRVFDSAVPRSGTLAPPAAA
jgi:hypothetical protein